MIYLDKDSLFKTVDNVSEALLFGLKIDNNEVKKIVDFIVNQQGKPRAYADTFAPTEIDLKNDLILFTGERIKTSVGKCHMIGEEASRVLRKLDLQDEKVKTALHQADNGLQKRIFIGLNKPDNIYGRYCCKSCSCALWLNLSTGGINNNLKLLKAGLSYLKSNRDDKGKWKGFPYYYTLYVLNEMDPVLAMDEMIYVAKTIEKRLKKKMANESKYELRRNYISRTILDKVNSN